ncbi:ubiquitin carboxylterminal hydrolase L5 [Mucor ambiguus]|uniref:ubiquitinyl hydrolase 1 n=1 Tax=Mucor ambiguus TaxID=91626 RepID=A0A0C9M088_9FUNG|nr:ubiquitin carboxylterminal hydrolase L5 [Mucor ambiguus]
MSKESPPLRSNSWNFLEPDPGTFTKLCAQIGAQSVQVEQIKLLDREAIRNLRPIHGLIIIIKHKLESFISKDDSATNTNNHIYFSNQVVHDAYAMHALLNVLLNSSDTVDIGRELEHFKQFTNDFNPMLKGLTLTNSHVFRQAHNSLSSRTSNNELTSEIYHSISYIKSDGHVWELDGLKRGPLKLGTCNDNNWLDVAHHEISKRCEMYQRQNLKVTLWAVVEDRKLVYQRKLIEKLYVKRKIEYLLDTQEPEWRISMNVPHWEEEYKHTMANNERNRRGKMAFDKLLSYCKSFEQLPLQDQDLIHSFLRQNASEKKKDVMDTWLQIQDDALRLYENLGLELEKQEVYEKSHASHHKEVTEKEDKHRPKTKAEKKLEQQQHKLKKQAKAAEAKKGFE